MCIYKYIRECINKNVYAGCCVKRLTFLLLNNFLMSTRLRLVRIWPAMWPTELQKDPTYTAVYRVLYGYSYFLIIHMFLLCEYVAVYDGYNRKLLW